MKKVFGGKMYNTETTKYIGDAGSVEGLFVWTLRNCNYYELCGKKQYLLNEIGVLRGNANVLELAGRCPHTPEFLHFIDMQVLLLKSEVTF